MNSHPDFEMVTADYRKKEFKTSDDVWNHGFDFVLPKVIFKGEFEPIFYPNEVDTQKTPHLCIKVNNAQAFGRLMMLDYNKISQRQVTGSLQLTISKIIQEYNRLYGK